MIKKLLICLLPISLLAFTYSPLYEDGEPSHTGAPGERYCNDCHGGGAINSGNGSITIQSPGMSNFQYTPGQTYNMSVTVSMASSNIFGVDIEALNYLNGNAGTLHITDPVSTHLLVGYVNSYMRYNITHTDGGGYSPAGGSKVFNFSWTAPSSPSMGTVTFYFSGISSDTSGYHVYASSQAFTDAACSTPAKPNSISGSSTLCSGSTFNYSIAPVSGASSYSWSLPPGWLGTSSTTSINGIAGNTSGNIFVTANNSCGGSPARTKSISVTYIQPDAYTVMPTCNGDSDGSITLSPYGGSSPYTYLWSDGNTTAIDSNIAAGNYTVTITEGSGCSGSPIITLYDRYPVTAYINHVNPLCHGDSTGSAQVNAWGGSYNFSYSWNPSVASTSLASNLAAGIYSVTVTDWRGCSAAISDTLTDPPALTLTTSQNNILCNGDSTGNAAISVSGGIPGYTYYWLPYGGSDSAANSLSVGQYTVRLTDSGGCILTLPFTITEPPPINIGISATDDFCNTANGSISTNPAGGTGPYTYSWSTFPIQHNSGLINLGGGTFYVTVTDANNCAVTSSVTINQPASLTAVSSYNIAICEGTSTQIGGNPTASGGTSPYFYQWTPAAGLSSVSDSNPLASPLTQTFYTVLITDVNNCTASSIVDVNINLLPAALISSNGDTLFSTPGYSYLWMDSGILIGGAVYSSYVPLQNGNYSVVVIDSNGCMNTSADFNFTTLGLNILDPLISYKIYPNPAVNFISIYCPDLFLNESYKIFDVYGDCVGQGFVQDGYNKINLEEFAAGKYYLAAGFGNNLKIKQFIISK